MTFLIAVTKRRSALINFFTGNKKIFKDIVLHLLRQSLKLFILILTLILFSSHSLYCDDFLQELKQKEEQIKSLQADMEMNVIVAPQGKMKQTGKYYYLFPDKLRMDMISPIPQSILLIGQKVYLKTIGSPNFIESTDNEIKSKLYSSDLYGYHYLNQYVYDVVTNRSVQKNNSSIEIYQGYEIINKEKVRRVRVIFNKEKGIVQEYSIFGNTIIPSIQVKYGYKKINDHLIPVKVFTRVHYQMGQSDTLIKIKNVILNGEINEQVFVP